MNFDATTFDLSQTCLRLKNDLSFSVQQGNNHCWYLIEDESRNQFFRIGPAEYTFLSMLNGNTTLSTALAKTCSLMGVDSLAERDAIQLCKWMVDAGLAINDSSIEINKVIEEQSQFESGKKIQQFNPISVRIPLVDLDHFAKLFARYCTVFFCWPAAIVWLMVCMTAAVMFGLKWEQFQIVSVASRDNWIWFALTWFVLKGVHELAHVVSCKMYGGKVGKAGVLFLLLIPMPYVDVTSAWRFPSKRKRILVSSAGMLAEVFIASIAAIIWAQTEPGFLNFQASNVMIAASLHTLLFNANPLMRFDGYYILSDWLELPNLGNHGSQFLNGFARGLFFDLPSHQIPYAGFKGQIVRAYGVGAFVWKVLVCVGLSVAAINLFNGVGLFLALFGMVLWIGLPVYRLLKLLLFGNEFETLNRVRFALVVSGLTGVLMLVGLKVPAPSVVTAPAVVEFKDDNAVRAETAGFVSEICVKDQQSVEKGTVLLRLENRELESRKSKLKLEKLKAEIKERSLQNAGEIGSLQAQQSLLTSLDKQLSEVIAQEKKLEIRATSSGTVIARNLRQLKSTYVEAGQELLFVGNARNKKIIALVDQVEARNLSFTMDSDPVVEIWGLQGKLTGNVTNVEPRATNELPHFAFAATFGGAVDVVERAEVDGRSDVFDKGKLKMLHPQVELTISLEPKISEILQSGQTGYVHFRERNECLGKYVVTGVQRWLTEKIVVTHGL